MSRSLRERENTQQSERNALLRCAHMQSPPNAHNIFPEAINHIEDVKYTTSSNPPPIYSVPRYAAQQNEQCTNSTCLDYNNYYNNNNNSGEMSNTMSSSNNNDYYNMNTYNNNNCYSSSNNVMECSPEPFVFSETTANYAANRCVDFDANEEITFLTEGRGQVERRNPCCPKPETCTTTSNTNTKKCAKPSIKTKLMTVGYTVLSTVTKKMSKLKKHKKHKKDECHPCATHTEANKECKTTPQQGTTTTTTTAATTTAKPDNATTTSATTKTETTKANNDTKTTTATATAKTETTTAANNKPATTTTTSSTTTTAAAATNNKNTNTTATTNVNETAKATITTSNNNNNNTATTTKAVAVAPLNEVQVAPPMPLVCSNNPTEPTYTNNNNPMNCTNQMGFVSVPNAPSVCTPCTPAAPTTTTTYVVDKYGRNHNMKVIESNNSKPNNMNNNNNNGGFFSQLYNYFADHLSGMNRGNNMSSVNNTHTTSNRIHGNNNSNDSNNNFFSRFYNNHAHHPQLHEHHHDHHRLESEQNEVSPLPTSITTNNNMETNSNATTNTNTTGAVNSNLISPSNFAIRRPCRISLFASPGRSINANVITHKKPSANSPLPYEHEYEEEESSSTITARGGNSKIHSRSSSLILPRHRSTIPLSGETPGTLDENICIPDNLPHWPELLPIEPPLPYKIDVCPLFDASMLDGFRENFGLVIYEHLLMVTSLLLGNDRSQYESEIHGVYGKIYGLTFEQHMKCLSNLMTPQMRSIMMSGSTNVDWNKCQMQELHFDEQTLKLLRRHSTDEVFSKRVNFLLHTIQHCADKDEENDVMDNEVESEDNANDDNDEESENKIDNKEEPLINSDNNIVNVPIVEMASGGSSSNNIINNSGNLIEMYDDAGNRISHSSPNVVVVSPVTVDDNNNINNVNNVNTEIPVNNTVTTTTTTIADNNVNTDTNTAATLTAVINKNNDNNIVVNTNIMHPEGNNTEFIKSVKHKSARRNIKNRRYPLAIRATLLAGALMPLYIYDAHGNEVYNENDIAHSVMALQNELQVPESLIEYCHLHARLIASNETAHKPAVISLLRGAARSVNSLNSERELLSASLSVEVKYAYYVLQEALGMAIAPIP